LTPYISTIDKKDSSLAPKSANRPSFFSVPKINDRRINVRQRIVLAGVIYRLRLGKGASVKWLANVTGFDRCRTVKKALVTLAECGYIYQQDRQWFARNPYHADLLFYLWRQNQIHKEWYKNIRTMRLGLPFDREVNLVAWALSETLPYIKPYQTKSGLGKMLGETRWAIRGALDLLQDNGLLALERLYRTTPTGKQVIERFKITLMKSDKPTRPQTAPKLPAEAQSIEDDYSGLEDIRNDLRHRGVEDPTTRNALRLLYKGIIKRGDVWQRMDERKGFTEWINGLITVNTPIGVFTSDDLCTGGDDLCTGE
jgi:hypothetical protein